MTNTNVELVYKLMEAWNTNSWETVEALHVADFIDHTAPPGVDGLTNLKMTFDLFRSAFSDYKIEVNDVLATDDKAVWRWRLQGTHDGDFMGIPPSGNEVTLSAISIANVKDGKCAEAWAQTSMLNLMQQLGAIPA